MGMGDAELQGGAGTGNYGSDDEGIGGGVDEMATNGACAAFSASQPKRQDSATLIAEEGYRQVYLDAFELERKDKVLYRNVAAANLMCFHLRGDLLVVRIGDDVERWVASYYLIILHNPLVLFSSVITCASQQLYDTVQICMDRNRATINNRLLYSRRNWYFLDLDTALVGKTIGCHRWSGASPWHIVCPWKGWLGCQCFVCAGSKQLLFPCAWFVCMYVTVILADRI